LGNSLKVWEIANAIRVSHAYALLYTPANGVRTGGLGRRWHNSKEFRK